jgi:pyruvate kinase
VTPTEVWTRVVVGGRMKARQGVNVPGLTVDCPALTVKDIADAEFLLGLEPPVDYIALSFVQSAADLQAFIDLMDRLQVPAARRPKLCPKIEKPQALANLGGILGKCGALMVARGDLGVEVGPRRGRTAVSEEEAPVLLVNPA